MEVVSVSSSAARTTLGLNTKLPSHHSALKRPLCIAFKGDKPNNNNSALVAPQEQIPLPIETSKKLQKRIAKTNKLPKRVRAVFTNEASPSTLDVYFNEAAAKLESIFKLSPPFDTDNAEAMDGLIKRLSQRRKKIGDEDKDEEMSNDNVVRNQNKKAKRLSLDTRKALKNNKREELVVPSRKKRNVNSTAQKIEELVREYSGSTDLVSLDWRKMKIPPVLSSSEQAWLFKLMQPMQVLVQVKDGLKKDLGIEPTEGDLADATNMSVVQVRKVIEVGRAARNKLIKHNLRLVMFVIKKYFQDFANGPRYQDLCQAGVKGLITTIDRFEPRRSLQLSTYGLFWIRHAITRTMTLSSFTRVPFGLESVRVGIQKAKLELTFGLQRLPTEEEIIEKVGISSERYYEVMKASKPILSLHSKHVATQEVYINGITDGDSIHGDNKRQPALLRLALDDVLDSLKPKESLVIRQRFGLDGKGDRTLGEIAGNLNISREMVRKHEVKALLKLKHPARMDYLRRFVA